MNTTSTLHSRSCLLLGDERSAVSSEVLELSADEQQQLVAGARDLAPVRGLTHGFYKYPARFSPAFARAAISAFTQPGDLVVDNHMGGGTTLVEALALGRRVIGVDISALAEFVATVKTTLLDEDDLERLSAWAARAAKCINIHKASAKLTDYAELGYYKHLDHASRWRIRKGIEQTLHSVQRVGCERLEAFGRCVILRTAQWALDGRKAPPTICEFRERLLYYAGKMIAGAREFSVAVRNCGGSSDLRILNRSAAGLEHEPLLRAAGVPRLVLTSPPYPGIHVLYHRWQVGGGRESPVPFIIANKLDGAGSSYYTMGDRNYPKLKTYFDKIRASMASVAAVADRRTVVVQMVAFSDPTWQLPRYLEAMEKAGFVEAYLRTLRSQGDGRLWRTVPGRRWYSDQRGETPGSQEVVLLHKKR